MTPNGGVLFGAAVLLGAMATRGAPGLGLLLGTLSLFMMIETGKGAARAFMRSAMIVLPLAAFMLVVWVGIVGRAPPEIAAGAAGTRRAAFVHVSFVCARLFVIALAVQLVILRFANLSTLTFIRDLTAPHVVKKLLVLTFSLLDTVLYAVERARTALIAAGLIAARVSLRNIVNGWILIQTVWLAVIAIVLGRVRDKWPIEDTLDRLDVALACATPRMTPRDIAWLVVAIAAALGAGFI